MNSSNTILLPAFLLSGAIAGSAHGADVTAYREAAERIIAAATSDGRAWSRLTELTDTFGHRLSGSPQLEAALRWAEGEMKEDGLDNVRLEPVMVPHWVRGRERLSLVEPDGGDLVVLGLGGSVGTPQGGITAEVLAVKSFEDLDARAAEAKGRIVLYDVPYTTYGQTVRYRAVGASRAAKHGAVAMLLRSVGLPGLRTPHTGSMFDPREEAGVAKIPGAAIPLEDADRLQRLVNTKRRVVVRLEMEAKQLPDARSANLIAELTGREKPEEIVAIGGHIDSWDVGTGAMDDGGGSVVVWEAARLLKSLGLRPRRTVRVVWFTNEENGVRGAFDYRDKHRNERHVAVLESDSGVFKPRGFGFTGSDVGRAIVRDVASLLGPIGATEVLAEGDSVDFGPLATAVKVPVLSLAVEGSKYFLLHHTPADTLDKLKPEEVAHCAAAIAVMAYVLADLPEGLGPSSITSP